MKIDNVMESLYKKYHKLRTDSNDDNYVPKLAVYMDYDFYVECKNEIQGQVSVSAIEFLIHDKLMHYPVYTVMSIKEDINAHPFFVIVNLDV